MNKLSTISILLLMLFSCRTEDTKERWPFGVNYEVFVLSFADGNGDGNGDLRGLTSKLDYLKDLGVGGLWLMPIMPSPSYHKYDVIDYKGIDPTYGTMKDFKLFVEEAHKRGIQVIIDMILNHTDRKSTRLNSSHPRLSRMPSSA